MNLELFTNTAILEMESLAPLVPLAPGQSREHVEHWVLRPAAKSLADESAARDFFRRAAGDRLIFELLCLPPLTSEAAASP